MFLSCASSARRLNFCLNSGGTLKLRSTSVFVVLCPRWSEPDTAVGLPLVASKVPAFDR